MVFNPHPIITMFRKIRLGLLISSLSGMIIFYFMYFSEYGKSPILTEDFSYLAMAIVAAIIVGLCLSIASSLLNKGLPWNSKLSARLLAGLISNIIISIACLAMILMIYLTLTSFEGGIKELWLQSPDLISKVGIITLLSVLIYTVFDFALHSYNRYTYAHIETAQKQREYLELQFDVLKSQLSPHYLFNCLNTISALIFRDEQKAEDFIRRLASTYKYILDNSRKKYVHLKDELEFVKSYNYLLQVRFESNLKLDINIPDNILDSKIPPITLQMLVENAVKHNVISKSTPLNIYMSAIDNTAIKIANTKTEAPHNVDSFHVGLSNIQHRYKYLTKDKIRIENNDKYIVTLPVVKNKKHREE